LRVWACPNGFGPSASNSGGTAVYRIWAELEPMGDWYIRVNHPDGGYLYDGYWRNNDDKSPEEAVAEAFRGAELLEVAR
jgi:hypothetical protein